MGMGKAPKVKVGDCYEMAEAWNLFVHLPGGKVFFSVRNVFFVSY